MESVCFSFNLSHFVPGWRSTRVPTHSTLLLRYITKPRYQQKFEVRRSNPAEANDSLRGRSGLWLVWISGHRTFGISHNRNIRHNVARWMISVHAKLLCHERLFLSLFFFRSTYALLERPSTLSSWSCWSRARFFRHSPLPPDVDPSCTCTRIRAQPPDRDSGR